MPGYTNDDLIKFSFSHYSSRRIARTARLRAHIPCKRAVPEYMCVFVLVYLILSLISGRTSDLPPRHIASDSSHGADVPVPVPIRNPERVPRPRHGQQLCAFSCDFYAAVKQQPAVATLAGKRVAWSAPECRAGGGLRDCARRVPPPAACEHGNLLLFIVACLHSRRRSWT